ncbi:MAG: hypothetical protein M3165_05820 [Actinomycetota bacterium]|nr:hypothetical protein [Actinomycetota bacterium]
MRWEDLFADLEREWDALAAAGRQAEIAERTRAEYARVRLVDRLRGSEGRRVDLVTRGGRQVCGVLARVGADFVLVTEGRREVLVPLRAVAAAIGLGTASVSDQQAGAVRARLGLGSVLRRIAADRSVVTVAGPGETAWCGTVQRVGADFLELAEHALDETPHRAHTRTVVLVPFSAITQVRRESPG